MAQETSKRISRLLKEAKLNQMMEKASEKERLNDKGKIVPKTCPKCGGDIICVLAGEPIYKCKNCNKFFGVVPFPKK